MGQTPGRSGRRSSARLGLHPGSPSTRAAKKARKERLSKLGTASEKNDSNKVARLGLVVSLVVAVLSAVVAVVTTLVGASNNRQQAAEQFRRTQQQVAFADFIAASNAWRNAENLLRAYAPLGEYSQQMKDARADEIKTSLEWQSKLSMVELVASPATVSAAYAVKSEGEKLEGLLAMGPAPGDPPPGPLSEYAAKVYVSQENLRRNIEAFVDAARNDLGTFVTMPTQTRIP